MLNEEWLEFEALVDRILAGDTLWNLEYGPYCRVLRRAELVRFSSGTALKGQRVRVHTGRGRDHLMGYTHHVYLGRSWFVWNNRCGDRATLTFNGGLIDSAQYAPNPPEGLLVRQRGTDLLVPAGSYVRS